MVGMDNKISTPGHFKCYVRRRVGGAILYSEALKLLKVSAT